MSPEVQKIIEDNTDLIDKEDFLKLCDITIKRYDYSKWVEILKVFREADIEGDFEGIGHCILGYPASEAKAPVPRKENYIYRI